MIRVCIPSYRRPKVETLELFPSCAVYVDGSEAEAYREGNPGAEIIACPDGVQGNVSRVRNYILDREFEAGADCVVIMDDDMQGIYRFDHERRARGEYGYVEKALDEPALLAFIERAAILCDEWGFRFFGMNCVSDAMAYAQMTPFNTTKFIGGPFQGFLPNPLRYDERLPLKEDYDMTLQHLNRYRGVLRFNAYHYKCRQSAQAGGCATMRNMKREREQFDRLQRKWGPEIIRADKKSVKAFDYNPIMKSPIKGA